MTQRRRDYLAEILARKAREVARRRLREVAWRFDVAPEPRGDRAVAALRRGVDGPKVIAEVKFASPSAGVIRAREVGDARRVALDYERHGAAAVSVLADGPGFGGSPLTVRRVAEAVDVPVLFKEFVLDEAQVRLARAMGASMVLLLVRAMGDEQLRALVDTIGAHGMAPVVEAADEDELDRAVATGARIVGVNARDLATFEVDLDGAARSLERTPSDRVAVFMSGVRSPEDYQRVARTRADAVLVGEGLMRAHAPGERLAELRATTVLTMGRDS